VPRDAAGSGGSRGPAVLLLHGGSANHRTFTTEDGLADWLFNAGFDPWLLDWRGSSLVSDCPQNSHTLKNESTLYTFNRAAIEDVPAAIAVMRGNPYRVEGPIALVGHCMGAAVIAEAIARGSAQGIERIVLLALGLFYEAAIDSRVKSEERILERLALDVQNIPCIDPRVKSDRTLLTPWPADLDKLYEAWPGGLRAHPEDVSPMQDMCNRISFMYGMPYRHDNLAVGIHAVPDDTVQKSPKRSELSEYFGGFPLQMYLHAARNLREGQATSFDPTVPPIPWGEARARFIDLTKVTLITGESNRLWHRDSIDRMYEWLCRGDSKALHKIKKHVLPNYAHQDLLWGTNSKDEVYPKIGEGLGLSIGAGGAPAGPKPSTVSAVNQTAR
jgi:pimeloyl-ACP methyl ester carboxylesterase